MPVATLGLHHVTGIATRPQANIEFWVRLLGQRLVKRTVNYDDPQTYHFYFGGPMGQPGTVATFFPWQGAGPAVRGAGESVAVAYRVPPGGLTAWRRRLDDHGLAHATFERFGEEVVAFQDPDGVPLELTEAAGGGPRLVWPDAPLPDGLTLQGLHAVTVAAPRLDATASVLEEALGMRVAAEDVGGSGRRVRLAPGPSPEGLAYPAGGFIDLVEVQDQQPGRLGAGSLHHVALRVKDAEIAEARAALLAAGLKPTVVKDRTYFKSVYFKEPGGAILEVATDGPGFLVDEPADELGLAFKLPAWLESERDFLRARLPVTASPEYADRWRR